MNHVAPALATPSDLEEGTAKRVAHALNQVLADSFALYLKTKNFHWHMTGPYFRDYHLLLEEQAAEIIDTTDAIAERVRKIGETTLRSISQVQHLQKVDDNNAEFVPATEMLVELRRDNLTLVKRFREIKMLADEAKDNATSGIVDSWTDSAERRAWFLFEATR